VTSLCVTPIKARIIRLIKLDVCGNPVTGAASAVVTEDGFISVKQTPQYEDGTEFTKKRGDGTLCVNQKDPGQLKRVQLESVWCVIDPDVNVIMNGARLITTAAVTGTGNIFTDALVTQRFSLEVWQNITGRGACDVNGVQRYVYWAWPNCGNSQVQDSTAQNDALEWHQTMETASAGALWSALTTPTGFPPSNYLSGSTFVPGDHYGYNVTTAAPPTAACGAVVLA
jgi:hypothetical protein